MIISECAPMEVYEMCTLNIIDTKWLEYGESEILNIREYSGEKVLTT